MKSDGVPCELTLSVILFGYRCSYVTRVSVNDVGNVSLPDVVSFAIRSLYIKLEALGLPLSGVKTSFVNGSFGYRDSSGFHVLA